MTAARRPEQGTVYLLHFNRAFKHARHYLGWTTDLEARLRRHRGEDEKGRRGSRLVEIVTAAGIDFEVVRLWRGDRHLERRIKGRGLAAYCPTCSQRPRRPYGAVEILHSLKTDFDPFEAVVAGRKPYEIRVNDRGYDVGHALRLRQTARGDRSTYTGREALAVVTYMTPGGEWGLPAYLCVLGIHLVRSGV